MINSKQPACSSRCLKAPSLRERAGREAPNFNDMNFLELSKARYSVRSYQQRAIENEKLQYVMECTRLAPSAVNLQPWKFFVVSKPEDCDKIRQCYHRDWFNEAPMYIIACSNHDEAWKRRRSEPKDHADIDISIAVEHLCLAAAEQGLGTCWVNAATAFGYGPALRELFAPDKGEFVSLVTLGYSDQKARAPGRKPDRWVIR